MLPDGQPSVCRAGQPSYSKNERTSSTDSNLAQENLLGVVPSSNQMAGGDVEGADQESFIQLVSQTPSRSVATGLVERYSHLAKGLKPSSETGEVS